MVCRVWRGHWHSFVAAEETCAKNSAAFFSRCRASSTQPWRLMMKSCEFPATGWRGVGRGGGEAPERRALCEEGICRGSEQEERGQDGDEAVHLCDWAYERRCQKQRERVAGSMRHGAVWVDELGLPPFQGS